MKKPLACRLGRHKWERRSTSDGNRYTQCSRCGKDDNPPQVTTPFTF
ncbi:hypothetical protein ACTI_08630 [Actinoplanes sp. OR16]|nr:DUF1660 family phage protein [Actinoplanes sp. OR16]BBH64178.1 hypothetical protein ACTI_08630 [Actinoplanes sp. OR16]